VIIIALKKLCSWHGCNKVVDDAIKYCEAHQIKFEQQEKERYKEYSNRRRQDKEQNKRDIFYNSDEWKRVRDAIISHCCGIDIVEYYKTGKIVKGERVHHIIELESDWNSRLDINNLIYLSEQNHRRVHVEYDKGQREKKQMQDILFGLLSKWNEEFGGVTGD
jgi:5-methylcytosine-specific restriction endonuclease McrA